MEVDNDKSAEKSVAKEVVASSEKDDKAEIPTKTEEKMEQDENAKPSEDKSIPEIVVVSSDVVDSEGKKDSVVDTTVVEKVSTDTNDKVPTESTLTEVTTSAEKAAPVTDTEVDEVSSSSKETAETEAEKPSTVSEEPTSTKTTNEDKTTNVDDKANKVEEKATNVEEKIESTNGVAKETNGTSENGIKNGNGKEEKHDSDKENDEQGKNIPETPASPVVASDDKDVEDVVSDIKAKKAAAAIDSAAAPAPIVASTET